MEPTIWDNSLLKTISTNYSFQKSKEVMRERVNPFDIVIIKSDESNSDGIKMVKRCIAIPGDTIMFLESGILVNGKSVNIQGQYRYFIFTENGSVLSMSKVIKETNSHLCDQGNSIYASTQDSIIILEAAAYFSIKIEFISENYNIKSTVLNSKGYDQIRGIYLIPKFNDSIKIDKRNHEFYKHIINRDLPNNTLISQLGKYYLFKNDYYFLLGDNRLISVDSRELGLIESTKIIGKVISVEKYRSLCFGKSQRLITKTKS